MKVYISGPITGYADLNRDAFTAAAAALKAHGFEPLNPHDCAPNSDTATWEECLRADIAALVNECDGIALLEGWEESRGSKLEIHVGMALHMRVEPIQQWLEEVDDEATAILNEAIRAGYERQRSS